MWIVLVAALSVACIELLAIPMWVFVVIAAPTLIIILIYASFLYNSRESLQLEAIPRFGYSARLSDLERESKRIEFMGFRKTDMFYLKTIPDSITYVFKHEKEPCYFCLYHFGQKYVCDFITHFEGEFSLTTANTVDAGLVSKPVRAFLQIYPRESYDTIFSQHMESLEYISRDGIHPFDIPEGEFRFYFMKNLREQAAYIRKLPFWPLTLLINVLARHGKIYCRSIREQYPQGVMHLLSGSQ